MTIGVWPDATVASVGLTGMRLPLSASDFMNVTPGAMSSADVNQCHGNGVYADTVPIGGRTGSVVQVSEGRVTLASYYLAVQNKGADAWCFIDTAALTAASLRELFPGAPADLQLPAQAHAIVQRDGSNN